MEETKKFSKFQMFEMPDGRTYAQGIEEGHEVPEPPPGAKDLRIVGESKYLRQGQRLRITAAYDLPLEERRRYFALGWAQSGANPKLLDWWFEKIDKERQPPPKADYDDSEL